MNPLVSIIIPVYNGANYMREAIDSALKQTYPNIEILVINDGSDDNGKTREQALSYGKKIRYYEKKNGGVSTALNLAIQNMKGEYFSWLSHDDIYHPEKISMQIKCLNESQDKTLSVYSGWARLVMSEKRCYTWEENENRYSKNFFESGLFAVTMGLISGCSLLIPKRYFDEYGLFDENLRTTQDYAKWFEMFKNKKILYVNQPLVQSRVHENQTGVRCKSFQKECDSLHVWMVENITSTEVESLDLDLYHFYSILLSRLYRVGYINAYQCVYKKLLNMEEPLNVIGKIEGLNNWLRKMASITYIYCAGRRGRALMEYFNLRNISIEGFCDSDKKLWNTWIDKKKCFAPKEIRKENALIIVSMINPQKLKEFLLQEGFKNVVTYDEIAERLCQVPVNKKCLLKYKKEAIDNI